MLEETAFALGINLTAAGITAGTSLSKAKAAELTRKHRIDTDLDDLATTFSDELATAVEEVNADRKSGELTGVTDDWDAIVRELHGLNNSESLDDLGEQVVIERLAFENEEAAVNAIAEAIATVRGFDLQDAPQLEHNLKHAVAIAYRRAIGPFIERIGGTDLGHALELEAQIEEIDALHTIVERLDTLEARLAAPQHYDWIDVSEGSLEAAASPLAPRDFSFVKRPELKDHYDTSRLLLLGPGGSGKSRALADLVEHYERDIAHVVRIRDEFKDQEHLQRLRRERFDGDVLLVWDDIHAITPEEENLLFRKTVSELGAAVPDDARLHVLAAARIENIEQLPGSPLKQATSDTLWSGFTVVELEPLTADVLASIFESALDELNVEASNEVKEQFLRKALETDPSPIYVTSVVETADELLTEDDIKALPDSALGIWQDQYADIDSPDDERRYVLWSFKILTEVGLPLFRSLIKGVYTEIFNRSEWEFEPPLEELEARQWFVKREFDAELAVRYEMHDIKAEAIDESIEEAVRRLSDLLLADASVHLPSNEDNIERDCHGLLGQYFNSRDLRNGNRLAEEHYRAIIGDEGIDPLDEITHNNYAILLGNELDDPQEAADHYERALDIDPELVEAHYNYASLLWRELDRPTDARNHLETSVRLWTERGTVRNALHDLKALVSVCRELEDEDAIGKWVEEALSLCEQLPNDTSDEEVWFQIQRTRAELGLWS